MCLQTDRHSPYWRPLVTTPTVTLVLNMEKQNRWKSSTRITSDSSEYSSLWIQLWISCQSVTHASALQRWCLALSSARAWVVALCQAAGPLGGVAASRCRCLPCDTVTMFPLWCAQPCYPHFHFTDDHCCQTNVFCRSSSFRNSYLLIQQQNQSPNVLCPKTTPSGAQTLPG